MAKGFFICTQTYCTAMTNEAMREYCLSLPGATEGIKWEENLALMVGEKIFCLTEFDEGCPVALKVTEERFDELTARDGITQAPHWAKRKWVAVVRRNALNMAEWKAIIDDSYALVKAGLTKQQRAAIDGQ